VEVVIAIQEISVLRIRD